MLSFPLQRSCWTAVGLSESHLLLRNLKLGVQNRAVRTSVALFERPLETANFFKLVLKASLWSGLLCSLIQYI